MTYSKKLDLALSEEIFLTTQPESSFPLPDFKNKESYTGAAGGLITGAKSNASSLAASRLRSMVP